jgi:hypothetical protein
MLFSTILWLIIIFLQEKKSIFFLIISIIFKYSTIHKSWDYTLINC